MKSHVTSAERYGLTLRVVEAGRRHDELHPPSRTLAEIGREIVFDPDALSTYNYEGWQPIHHDLLVVSAAVEYADRSTARRVNRWGRHLDVTVPVVEVATWQRPEVRAWLRKTLRHLTGDDWQFTFVPWPGQNVLGAQQRSLPFGTERTFVIAYSDGLDSRCVSKLSGSDAVCVRVTKHRHVRKAGDEPFDQIPFRVSVPSSRESSVRSRGFKFAAVTAIAAHLTGLNRIVVPESGQGALGPVLLPLHNVYADYRNHPTYFRKMERFIRALLGHEVRYEQPRLWNTKGETIAAFRLATSKAVDELFETRSCWQQRWNVSMDGKRRQCGLCAACVLRRVSMHAAGIEEPKNTYVIADLTVRSFRDALPDRKRVRQSRSMAQYASVGVRHFQQLADMAELPFGGMKVHAFEIARATGEPLDDVLRKLRTMLLTHAKEWRAFTAAQGEKSFLRSWTNGGRHVRSE